MILLRLMFAILVVGGIFCMMPYDPVEAGDKDKKEAKKVELKGIVKTGIFAIGGETTGTIIETKEGNYELAVSKELRADVDKLNKLQAIVTGTLIVRKGVEVKQRKIVTVETIKADDAK
jgi:hypothetical protein